jgi:hypothetical protein
MFEALFQCPQQTSGCVKNICQGGLCLKVKYQICHGLRSYLWCFLLYINLRSLCVVWLYSTLVLLLSIRITQQRQWKQAAMTCTDGSKKKAKISSHVGMCAICTCFFLSIASSSTFLLMIQGLTVPSVNVWGLLLCFYFMPFLFLYSFFLTWTGGSIEAIQYP